MRTSANHLRAGVGFLASSCLPWLTACAPPRVVLVERGPQAYYQTAFPVHDTSGELARVFLSVKQVMFSAEYRTYQFREAAGVTEADVRAGAFQGRADSTYSETVSKAGTATVVARSGNRLTLLTTAHLVHFPELRIEYWDDASANARAAAYGRVASVSVKTSQQGILSPQGGTSLLSVVARDDGNDLALLAAAVVEVGDTTRFLPLDLPAGDARRLSWGSFVYVVGYPRSIPMVTRAIVSSPERDGRGGFVTDGLWNEGISGGLILGVRGDTGALEVVGLARAAVGEREVRLQPDTTGIADDLEVRRYDGPLYLQRVLRIRYGITLPVPMTVVGDFLRRNRVTLNRP